MSEIWKDLVSGADRDLAALLSLGEVTLSRSTGALLVKLNASRLLSTRERDTVETALRKAFPGSQFSLKINYPALKEDVLNDISKYKSVLIGRILEESPGSAAFLGWESSVWELKGDVLKISVSSRQGAEFLKLRRMDSRVRELLSDVFGITAGVEISYDGDEEKLINEINRRRQEEEERIRQEILSDKESAETVSVSTEAILGRPFTGQEIAMRDIAQDAGKVIVMGEIISCEVRDTRKDDCKILALTLTDYTSTLPCKAFIKSRRGKKALSFDQQLENVNNYIKPGKWLKVSGDFSYDEYDRCYRIMIDSALPASKPERRDTAREKRVELHLHTNMSSMDAVASPTDLINQAAKWGHPAIAITDHGVVQAFPEAFDAAKKAGIKLIPGCEGYLIDDMVEIVERADQRKLDSAVYVVLDVETTGLNTYRDRITEIGAVRIENGKEVGEFSMLIDPGIPVPEEVTRLTGITNQMLMGKPRISDAIIKFGQFCTGSVLVAHNAAFDMMFIGRAFRDAGLVFDHPVIDTLSLCRNFYTTMKTHKLGQICKELGISLTNAHRAVHDARATSLVLLETLKRIKEEKPIRTLDDLNAIFEADKGGDSHHVTLLATSRQGMTNLNRMVSDAHLKYFHRTPRMPRGLINKYRQDVLVGSACEAGELYRAFVEGKSSQEIERIAEFYDYLEIQPLGNNAFMLRQGMVDSEETLKNINIKILELGRRLGKPVVATGDVHFLEEKDAVYRSVLQSVKGFEDADRQPPLFFRTTGEMLKEFEYLGKDDAKYVVIDAPNQIADRVERIDNLFMRAPDGGETFQPFWEDAEENLRHMCENCAGEIFGSPLPEIVRKRLDKELSSICGYGFSTLYMIAVKLVDKSLKDGYIVGSRGSVGSSLVAYLAGITEVNALPPYYVCPKCRHSEFDVPKEYTCGLDLPEKQCPVCGQTMHRDGFNIPFEVFLGFKGDKVPDIDLNFSGVYQPTAHQYVKELFGEENVFRAGTISTVAEKTAFGYVLKYAEERGLNISQAEKERLAKGITGVKRTTGQHPAGMVVLPKGYEIYQFTAIQHPADDFTSDTITTHFDFSSMHDVLVKLDILGHDDPTMLRNLQDLTGIKPQQVPLSDKKVFDAIISLFSSPEALGLTAKELGCETGTLGIPEFGTQFVRGMLTETRPSSMEELVRISGLSHGTAVWVGNIQDILKAGKTDLKHAICTRDDIMNQLMDYGVEPKMAFTIMEFVRKGKASKGKGGDLKPDMLEAMVKANTPEWFIEACRKIEYMFPKAHAVAYVTMALRIAYFKIFHPAAYYACFLHRNTEAFDGSTMIAEVDALRGMMKNIEEMEKSERERNDDKYSLMESLVEMYLRGIRLLPVDLYASDAEKFIVVDDKHILPPVSSLPGLGLTAALNLVEARKDGRFISREDMLRRKVGKSVIDTLARAGCLEDVPETSQVSLFDV
ncbi:MAG: PolC-type DNA polymerase III [Clostridiales bacterium]|nr:PolC-type DNA polymerase III [Clostridiales bacterium]